MGVRTYRGHQIKIDVLFNVMNTVSEGQWYGVAALVVAGRPPAEVIASDVVGVTQQEAEEATWIRAKAVIDQRFP